MGRVRAAIIGCGLIAQERHGPELAASQEGELAGFFDFDRQRAEDCAQKFGGKVYESMDAVFEDKSLDAIVLCTPNQTHAPLSIRALESGLSVLCEKPMSTTLEEAVAVAEAEKHAKGIFMAAHNQRYTMVHRRAKEWIESGRMGKVISFRCTLAHPGPERYGMGRNRNTWYMSADNKMGCVTDLGIHKCDAIQFILGEKIKRVSAYAGTLQKTDENGVPIPAYDNAVAILESESGVVGTLNLSYTNYSKMDNSTIYYCEKGVLRCQHYDDCALEIVMDGAETIRFHNPDVPHINSGVMDAFIGAIRGGKPSPVSAQDALRSIQVCFAIDQSSREGRIVTLE